jgi:ABC-type iron transport system FetAB permease component
MLSILILISIIISLIEGIPLVKKKLWKELSAVLFLIISAVLLGIAKFLGMSSLMHILGNLLYPLGKKVFRYE